jgi:DNA-binding Xre family transcriptional regulator
MEELARMMINEGWSAEDIIDATNLDENDLAKLYKEEGRSMKETADEL